MKAIKINKNQNSTKKGFTIIEVVLVLAIAGLIFLMVFLALPALQRAQRDTQRKQDVAMVVTALHNWKANNQGRSYTTFGDSDIVSSALNDEDDKKYNLSNIVKPVKNSPLNNYIGFSKDNLNRNDNSSSLSLNTSIVTTIITRSSATRLALEGYGAHRRIAVVINRGCENMESLKNGDALLKGLKPGAAAVVAFLESGGAYCQEA